MRLRHLALLGVFVAVGCLVPQYAVDSSDAPVGGSAGGGDASSTAGTSSAAAGKAAGGSGTSSAGNTSAGGSDSMGGEPPQGCDVNEKSCDGKCVAIDDVMYGCTETSCNMSQCPAAGTATLACVDGACVLGSCGPGTKKCDDKCVAIDDPTYGCGDTSCAATACPDPGPGTLVCNGGKCELGTCSADTKACSSKCVPLDANNGCGEKARCSACAANETCQGTPSKCTCIPDDVEACKGKACGPATNNCSNTVQCKDTCLAPNSCGGGNAGANSCGCTPDNPCGATTCGQVTNRCNKTMLCPYACPQGQNCFSNKCLECQVDADCPDSGNVCAHPTCKQNKCSLTPAAGAACPAGTCSAQLVGVCTRPAVDAGGVSIDATEVTRGQYLAFLQAASLPAQPAYCTWNASYVPDTFLWPPALKDYDLPVADVDFCDAYAYCKWAGRRLCGKIGGGTNAINAYTDPTLSQWMHACVGPNNYSYPYGNSFDSTKCVGPLVSNSERAVASFTQCVGGYPGLYDMTGNVHEWEDSCSGTTGMNDTCRQRGGSFRMTNDDSGIFMRCDVNQQNPRTTTDSTMGFRCCGP